MYVPAAFSVTDLRQMHDFIHANGFGVLTTNGRSGMTATHLPLLLVEARGPLGTLQGHFAVGNEHSRLEECESLAVFSGPHAYISPTWYESPNTVPTWNYVAVHAYGKLRLINDANEVRGLLTQMVQKYESAMPEPWNFDPDIDYNTKLLGGIVGFEMEITRLEGKWKLNQNHPPERRRRVIEALLKSGSPDQQNIAKLMASSLEGGLPD